MDKLTFWRTQAAYGLRIYNLTGSFTGWGEKENVRNCQSAVRTGFRAKQCTRRRTTASVPGGKRDFCKQHAKRGVRGGRLASELLRLQ